MSGERRVDDLIEEAVAKLPTLSSEQVQYLASILTPSIWLKEVDQVKNPYAIPCPKCHAQVGEACIHLTRAEHLKWPHKERKA